MAKQLNNPDSEQTLPCLLVPIQGKNLIFPNVTIAEVVSLTSPVPVEKTPNWFLGYMNWRGEQVPVVSFEQAGKMMQYKNSRSSRIAVLNSTGSFAGLPFFAIIIQGIPRMARINESEVTRTGPGAASTEIMEIKTSAGNATIPDLNFLEKSIHEVIG